MQLASDFLESATRVVFRDVRSTTFRISPLTGVEYAAPRTAVAHFAATRQRSEDSRTVRDMAVLLVTVLELLEPGRYRVNSTALCMRRLAIRLDVSEREINRFVAVLRGAGIVQTVQPPKDTPGVRRSRTGRVYNVWMLMREQPRELADVLERWRAAHVRAERQAVRDAAVAPVTHAPRAQRGQAADFAKSFAAKYVPPD